MPVRAQPSSPSAANASAMCVRRGRELDRDHRRVLVVVAIPGHPLVATHRRELGTDLAQRERESVTLHHEDVTDVAAILESRPNLGTRMDPQSGRISGQASTELRAEGPQRRRNLADRHVRVDEAAFIAMTQLIAMHLAPRTRSATTR